MITEFKLPSADGRTTLRGFVWRPVGDVKAVVQLVHGMKEHILRYDECARVLTDQGYGVIGHDHLGHGASLATEEDLGFFAQEKGGQCLLKDMLAVTEQAKVLFPEKPVFMLAHSMGSFFARRYITLWPQALAGLVLSGTGHQPYLKAHAGRRLARLMLLGKGDHYYSPLVEKLADGAYGSLENWLCTRTQVVEAYREDPLCGFPFTVGAYRDFFRLLEQLGLEKDRNRIPNNLPVLLMAGMKDPVGDMSKGVLHVYNRFKAWGLTDVDVILYKDDMHEILNEEDRADVYRDLIHFLDERVERHHDHT